MEADKADALFQGMKDAGAADSIPQLFNQKAECCFYHP
jgi:hypothetical protein